MTALRNRMSGKILVEDLDIRSSFTGRLIGYLFRRAGTGPSAILLLDTRRVHTLGMAFPLDLYFFDRSFRCLGRAGPIPPGSFPPSPSGTRHILEIPSSANSSTLAIETGEEVTLLWRRVP